jgi:phosphohistidine phosphatase
MTERRLAIMRHAKSSWDDEGLGDHDRPLNERGRRAALMMGRLLVQAAWVPEQVLCSTARRTVETWQLMAEHLPGVQEVQFLPELYLPPVDKMVRALRAVPDEYRTVLLVSHNPGCERLVQHLLGRPLTFKTADVALLTATAADWYSALGNSPAWQLEQHLVARDTEDVEPDAIG